jgi:hypothetical protein
MRLVLISICFLFTSLTYSQKSYKDFIGDADKFYRNKDYIQSVEAYKQAFKIEKKSGSNLYDAACAAALAGNKKMAFQWLNNAMDNGWINIHHMEQDKDLLSLHKEKKWSKLLAAMQKIVDVREANYDKPLQAKLLEIFNDDQVIRHELNEARKTFGHQSSQVDSLWRVIRYKDSINLIKIKQILDTHGWVGPDKVGNQANQTLFLVIQHSDLKTQQQYLPMMREAVKNKNASGSALALLEDRVALGEGRKQIYGSQIGFDKEKNKSYIFPLEDPDHVDIRRAAVDLEPIADYVRRWDIIWDVEAFKKEQMLKEKKE